MKREFSKKCQVYAFAAVTIVLFTSALLLCSAVVKRHQSSLAPQKKFMLKFTNELYKKYTEENVVASPAAIHAALSLAYLGAEEDTLNELAVLLGYQAITRDREEVAQPYAMSFAWRPWRKGTKFELANRIFVERKSVLQENFNLKAKYYLHSRAEKINFDEPILAVNEINSWLAWKTKQKFIKNIVSFDDIARGSPLILVNALTFEAYWEQRFAVNQTFKGEFHLSSNQRTQVDMLYAEGDFKYAVWSELNATAIEIPFANSDISMLVILPANMEGMSLLKLENKLCASKFFELAERISKSAKHKVKLSLPKFNIEFSGSLKQILKELGLKDVFENPDFSDLLVADAEHAMPLSDVIHKTSMAINEFGFEVSEAANVTSTDNRRHNHLGDKEPAYVFTVDHPFMFFIKNSDTIYISGHVIKP